jgi:DNA-binding CsgD family transcriptional regulator
MLLTLSERDQSSVHRLLRSVPEPGCDLLPREAAEALTRLVACDVLRVREVDRGGRVVRGFDRTANGRTAYGGDAHTVRLAFRTSAGTCVVILLDRHGTPFSDRDLAVLFLVEPAIAALVRRRSRLEPDENLSVAERRVLELVAAGASNQEVADRLSVSVSTIRKHLEHSYRKLGVTNRTAAVAALREAGPPAVPEQRKGSHIG